MYTLIIDNLYHNRYILRNSMFIKCLSNIMYFCTILIPIQTRHSVPNFVVNMSLR